MNIVITGASRGIGKAIAEKFAAENHQVIICSRDEDKLKEIHEKFPSVIIYLFDMSADKQKFCNAEILFYKPLITIDVLVNNAGVFIPGKIIEEEDGVLEKTMTYESVQCISY
jgi:short-subunit dehydrogenase